MGHTSGSSVLAGYSNRQTVGVFVCLPTICLSRKSVIKMSKKSLNVLKKIRILEYSSFCESPKVKEASRNFLPLLKTNKIKQNKEINKSNPCSFFLSDNHSLYFYYSMQHDKK